MLIVVMDTAKCGCSRVSSVTFILTLDNSFMNLQQSKSTLIDRITFARLSSLSTTTGGFPLPEGISTWERAKYLRLVPYTEVSKPNTQKELCGQSKSCTHRNNFPRKCTAVPSCYSTFIAEDSIRILEERISHCPD